MERSNAGLKIGWARADITPDQRVYLAGQHYARVSEGVADPVTSTALAVESLKDGRPDDYVIMVSCDIVGISDELRDSVRAGVESEIPQLDPGKVFLNATHTHSAQLARIRKRNVPDEESGQESPHPYGIELDAMNPAEYIEFAAGRIAGAVKDAWQDRRPSAIGYGIGHAVVAHNRRLVYRDGSSRMYGRADTPEFSHVEGYEDHSVRVMTTYDESRNLTGIVVNVPCPSQVSEHIYEISADYWHDTRRELRRRFGEGLHVLAQCAPSGDLSPHVLIEKRAQERMWRLKDRDTSQNAPRREIAERIADAVGDILPAAEKELRWDPPFAHKAEILDLPRRTITRSDVDEAEKEIEGYRKEYESLLNEIENNPEIKKTKRWYAAVTRPYMKMNWLKNVERRFLQQQASPCFPIEVHAVVLGDIAFVTNPFELYLDYGVRMREWSNAVQTFTVQLAGSGSYLPSERTLQSRGYGSVPASTNVGPEGGEKLVQWSVRTMNELIAATADA